MKILMLSPYAPYPPISGGRIRQWEQIKYLGQRHELTVVSLVAPNGKNTLHNACKGICKQAITIEHTEKSLAQDFPEIQRLPWPVRTYGVKTMRNALERLKLAGFDIVIVEHVFMAQHRDLFSDRIILQEHNIESNIFKQYAEIPNVSEEQIFGIRKEQAFWKATWMHMVAYENRMWPTFPLRVTVSENDKQEMNRRCSSGRTIVIENGVNTHTIDPIQNAISRKILFMGTMDYYPNTDAVFYLVKSIMPFIWLKNPEVSLCIAGLNPPLSVMALASDPRIEVIANPRDMREIARQCRLTVVPLRLGGGTRIKILDSMAMGLPVVSTSIGCEGLTVSDGIDILIRDDPDQFAEAVLKIFSDDILRDTLRMNGRGLVEKRYDWKQIFSHLEQEMLELVERTG